jgi:hypothetical protein
VETAQLQPGKEATLTVHGQNLAGAVSLWTAVGEFAPQSSDNDNATVFAGTVRTDVVPGVYPFRVVTARGVSEAGAVVIDDLPHHALTGSAEDRANPQVIPAACIVNGFVNALKAQYFAVDLTAGEPFSVEVFACRLYSQLDPVLRLTDAAGNEVAFSDDVPGLRGDAQLSYTPTQSGRFVLQLRDVQYSGSGKHFFHLRVGRFPLVAATVPRLVDSGGPTEIQAIQPDGQTQVTTASASGAATLQVLPVAVRDDSHNGSGLAELFSVPGQGQSEIEPNDTRDTATKVDAGVMRLAGRLQAAGDTDWYRLTGTANQKLCVTSHTRDLGSPADVILQLWNADGQKLAENDDTGTADAQLVTTLPADGEYLLLVKDLTGQAHSASTYDLELNRDTGRLELTAASDHITVPHAGTASLSLAVKRLGFGGALTVGIQGLPEGLTAAPVYLAANQNTAVVTITSSAAADAAPATAFGPIHITGSIQGTFDFVLATVVTAAPKAGERTLRRWPQLSTDFFVGSKAAGQFSLHSDTDQVQLNPGASATVTLTAARQADWKEPIDVAAMLPKELPAGITISAAKIEQDSATLTVTADATAAPGRYSLFLQGTLTKDKTTVVQPVPVITVEVAAAAPQ